MEIDIKSAFGIAAALVASVNYLPYLIGVFKKTFRPHVFSWIIWTIMTAVIFVAQLSDGGGPGAWATGVTSVTLFFIAVMTIRNGKHNIKPIDYISFIGALSAIPIWIATQDPLWAVIIITFIETLGFIPTFRKAYSFPYEDSILAFSLTILKYALALVALTNYSLTTTLFPIALIVLSGSLVGMIFWRRSKVE